MPVRIQRKRTKGWKMPEGAIYVGRPTIYGNPFPVVDGDHSWAVKLYRDWLKQHPEIEREARYELLFKDIACWCPLDQPCHADVLLELMEKEYRSIDLQLERHDEGER